MMKITGLSHLFKWENLHNWWLTKYFFAPLYLNFGHICEGSLVCEAFSLWFRLCHGTSLNRRPPLSC